MGGVRECWCERPALTGFAGDGDLRYEVLGVIPKGFALKLCLRLFTTLVGGLGVIPGSSSSV